MSPDRLRECLAVLAWSQRSLAVLIDRDERQVRRWAAGDYDIPEDVAAWLEKLVRFHERNPPPKRAT